MADHSRGGGGGAGGGYPPQPPGWPTSGYVHPHAHQYAAAAAYAQHFQNLAAYSGMQQQQEAGRTNSAAASSGGGNNTPATSSYFPTAAANSTAPFAATPTSYSRPLPAHSPLPAHLRGGLTPTHIGTASTGHHVTNPYGGYQQHYANYASTQQQPQHNAAQSKDPRALTNGHLGNNHSASNYAAAAAAAMPASSVQQPQQYGNPKEFVGLSRPTSSDAKSNNLHNSSSSSSSSIPSSYPHHMHHPAAYGNGGPAAPSPYGFGNSTAPANSGNGGGNGNGYDAIAAQILNSFGGSQLSPNLIHPDLAKQQQHQEETQPALNLSRPSSPSRNNSSNNNNNTGSRDTAPPNSAPNAVPIKPPHHHQPRGPSIDSRTTGDVDMSGSKAAQHPSPAVDLSRTPPLNVQSSADQTPSAANRLPLPAPNPSSQQPLHHRLPFNPAALAATSTPTLPVPKSKTSSTTGAVSGEGSGTNSILLDALSREPTKLLGFKRRMSNSNSDSPKMKLKRLREDGAGREASSPSSFLVEGAGDDDPYSFENEEREATIQLTKFGSAAAKDSKSAAASAGGPVYKFKSALLSRESRTNSTESRSSTGSGSNFRATVFDRCERTFVTTCDALLEDLNSKSVAVSLRPNMDTYRDRLAARREKNANRGRKRKVPLEESGSASILDTSGDHDEDAVGEGSVVSAEEQFSGGDGDVVVGSDSKIFSDDEEAPLRPPSSSKNKKDKKAASTPSSKKSPGKKKKESEEADKNEDSTANKTPNGVSAKPSSEDLSKPPKKGGLWALPIVPKLPQKPEKKQPAVMSPSPGLKPKSPTVIKPRILKKEVDVNEVWRSAFGANKQQPTKKEAAEIKSEMKRESLSTTPENATKAKAKTFLDVKPEVRRRPRPMFGGLIHFSPDWEQRVRRHHQKCRIPEKLMRGMMVKPRILKYNSSSSTTSSSTSTPIREKFEAPSISPQDSKRALPPSNLHMSPPEHLACSEMAAAGSSKKMSDQDDSSSNDVPYSVVDAILEKRRLRHQAGARGYKQPAKKDRSVAFDKLPDEGLGLMATPGLPLLTTETTEVLMETSNFGNFRRQTLLRYLDCLEDSAELKSKVLDWRPEVLETKTRRQASEAKTPALHREIFGLDLEEAQAAREEAEALAEVAEAEARREYDEAFNAQNAPQSPTPSSPQSTIPTPETPSPAKKKPKKSKKKKEKEKMEQQQELQQQELQQQPQQQGQQPQQQQKGDQQQQHQNQEPGPSEPKEVKAKRPYNKKKKTKDAEAAKQEAGPSIPHWQVVLNKADEAASVPAPEEEEEPDESEYTPNEKEEQLQENLQGFALDLLDDNLSWSRRQVIQNLVIWEPVDPAGVLLPPAPPKYKKKAKKYKKRHSGMDFNKKKSANSKSRDASRAASEERDATDGGGDKPRQIRYTLENVETECKELVIDKGAGETILHRAAKMGYPDVVAYALDVLGMPPAIKDNAGVGPVHKAAFRGHADVVDILMRFGVDPNTNVKGTRPLHEALENGAVSAVASLLRHGADPLLYDYSGNMPIDLTEGDDNMRAYLSAVLADLHGKDSRRWNVSHEPSFHLPPRSLDGEEDASEKVQSQDEADLSSDEFSFEMTSHHPMPPYFKFPDRQGHYVLLSDLKTHKGATENRLKSIVTVEMSREDFVRTSRCCLLGYSSHKAKPDESGSDKLTLVFVDGNVKKMLGVEGAHSPTKQSSPSKPKLSSPLHYQNQSHSNPASSPSSSPTKSIMSSPISSPVSCNNSSPAKGGKKRKASSSSSSANT